MFDGIGPGMIAGSVVVAIPVALILIVAVHWLLEVIR
jgi:hypothetical protein